MKDETITPVFKGFEGCVFPGDITGYIRPVMMRKIFRSYVGVTNNNNPFLIALSTEGHFLVKHEDTDFWMTLDSLVENYQLNNRLGTVEGAGQ